MGMGVRSGCRGLMDIYLVLVSMNAEMIAL